MKFKKALVVILSLAMIVTLMPATAFATSTNTVAKVPTVASDEEMPATVLTLEVKDNAGWTATTEQKIKLTLTNATWNDNPDAVDSGSIVATDAIATGTNRTVLTPTASTSIDLAPAFISASDTSLEFSFTPAATLAKSAYVTLTIPAGALKSGTDDGAVSIAIDGLDSNVSSSTLTVANVGSSTTTATVNGTVKTFGRGDVSTSEVKTSIEVRETAVNSLKRNDIQVIKMTLPKGVTWNDSTVAGDMTSETSIDVTGATVASPTSTQINAMASGDTYISSDSRTVWFAFSVTGDETVRNVMTITPSFNISKTASTGDITVSLTGVNSQMDKDTVSDVSDLLVAKYGDESVSVYTTDTVPTIYSGYTKDSNDKNFTFKITLDESMTGSLSDGRYVDFNLPEAAQISGPIKAKLNSGSNVTTGSSSITIGEDNLANTSMPNMDKDTSSFSFEVPAAGAPAFGTTWKDNGANKITFEVPVTVDAAYTGDITCNVTGSKAGLDKDYDIVVAKAESPITVATKTTEVKTGVQTQQTADITITENVAGYLNDDTDNALVLSIDTLGLTKGMVISSFDSAKVTAGDLELGTVKIKSLDGTSATYANGVDYDGADVLVLPIKHSSTKVSTIEIKGVTVTLNRTLPEGGYNLDVAGSALITNGDFDNGDLVNKVVAAKDYVKIITPADSDTVATKIDATFVIGQASYTNNGTAVTMDAAPYIDSNSRTMVPIRYIAEACGVDNADITWNQATQTAKINGANTVVTVTMGSNIIQTSTGTITMDTTPVNSNGRIYVPLRFIANALNANVTWDGATKTITVTNGAN